MSETKRPLFPPNPNSNSKKKKKKKSESQAPSLRSHLQPDSVIISTLKCLLSQSQSSSSSSKTLNLPELDGIVVRKRLVSVVGRLIFTEKNGSQIDCSKIDIVVPSPPYVDSIGDFSSDALFILLVECDDTFMQLADIKFYDRFPCIMITSGGHLDSQTGIFLTRLKMELNLPVLALVDSDPRGFEILSNISHTTNLPTLDIKWMGMRPSDLDKYQIPENCRLPMTDQDMKAAKDLLKKDSVKRNKGWVKELQMMVKTRQKAEIMALCSFGLQYLTEVYLPLKLQQQDWL